MSDPRAQTQYQVRFAYGDAGIRELADVDVLVVADELLERVADELTERVADELTTPVADEVSGRAADESDPPITLATAASVAERVLAAQAERGDRVSVGVIARGRDDVSFSVEDVLAAGAVIDALAAVGIDHCSPEAAAVAAAYGGLRHATRHLVSASVTARLIRESSGGSGRSD